MNVTLPVSPSANRYWRKTRTGQVYVSAEAKAYRETVGWTCRAAGIEPLAGPVSLTLHVYFTGRALDTDNYVKILSDALQGHAYRNDNQVDELHVYRQRDRSRPRIEVEVKCLQPLTQKPAKSRSVRATNSVPSGSRKSRRKSAPATKKPAKKACKTARRVVK